MKRKAARHFLLSVDIEDWFHVENFKEFFPPEKWSSYEVRVPKNVERILALLSEHSRKATFFVLGWVAERFPDLVRAIHGAGHEIANHGYGHRVLSEQTPEEFRSDLERAESILRSITGERTVGYRAPSFSITDWAMDILNEMGYLYDSSFFPTSFHRRYGRRKFAEGEESKSGSRIFRFSNGLIEVPLSTLDLGWKSLPWGGGGYFRFVPYNFFKVGMELISRKNGAYVFYFHPWEIDDGQPRVGNLKLTTRLRHYRGLKGNYSKLGRMLGDFPFRPIRDGLGEIKMPKSECRNPCLPAGRRNNTK